MNELAWNSLVLDRVADEDDTRQYLLRDDYTGMTVREATPDDAPAIVRICSRAHQHAHAGLFHPGDLIEEVEDRFNEGAIRADLLAAERSSLLAVWNGYECGFAQLGPMPETSVDEHRRDSAELHALYVAPDWVRNGAGSMLVRAALALASDRGYRSLTSRVWERNQSALTFLRSWGFAEVGRELVTVGRRRPTAIVLLSRSTASGAPR